MGWLFKNNIYMTTVVGLYKTNTNICYFLHCKPSGQLSGLLSDFHIMLHDNCINRTRMTVGRKLLFIILTLKILVFFSHTCRFASEHIDSSTVVAWVIIVIILIGLKLQLWGTHPFAINWLQKRDYFLKFSVPKEQSHTAWGKVNDLNVWIQDPVITMSK